MQQLKRNLRHLPTLAMLIAAMFTSSIATSATVNDANPPRLSTSTIDQKRQPAHYPALLTEKASEYAPTAKQRLAAHASDFWIYSAGVDLSFDYDHDGHYSGFAISFDVDTLLGHAPVYAVLYLSLEGGPWNEYAVTGVFTVSGSVADDAVYVETELESGYPSGHYDHYLEIYDAHSHALLADYGPHDSHQWRGLPFEGYNHDQFNFDATLSLDFTGTGSFDPLTLLLFPALGVAACARRKALGK